MLTDRKITGYVDNVKSLSDTPSKDGVNAEALKAILDGRTDKEVKTVVNGISDDLMATTNGTSGADNIGIGTDTGLTGTTVKAQIKELKDGKVEINAPITGDTKCKVTYDAKGLVVNGADLTKTDLPAEALLSDNLVEAITEARVDKIVSEKAVADYSVAKTNIINAVVESRTDKIISEKALVDYAISAGAGDMLKAVFDPQVKNTDAFNAANHTIDIDGVASKNTQGAMSEVKASLEQAITEIHNLNGATIRLPVADGETITAGDIVDVVNNKMAKYNPLYGLQVGATGVFSAGTIHYTSCCSLTDTKGVLGYHLAGDYKAVVFELSGDAIIFGTPLGGQMGLISYGSSMAAMSPSSMVSVGAGSTGVVGVYTINDLTINRSGYTTYYSTTVTGPTHCCKLNDSRVVAYINTGGGVMNCVVIDIVNNGPSPRPPVSITLAEVSNVSSYHSLTALDEKVICAYGGSNSGHMFISVGYFNTMNGNLSFEPPYEITSYPIYGFIGVERLSSSQVLVVTGGSNGRQIKAILVTLAGVKPISHSVYTTPTITVTSSISHPSIVRLDMNRFAIKFIEGGYIRMAILEVYESTISVKQAQTMLHNRASNQSSVCAVGFNRIVTFFEDLNNSSYGTAIVAKISADVGIATQNGTSGQNIIALLDGTMKLNGVVRGTKIRKAVGVSAYACADNVLSVKGYWK